MARRAQLLPTMTFLETQQAKTEIPSAFGSAVRQRLEKLAAPTVELMKTHPLLAVGLVFGAGLILGSTLFSRMGRLAAFGLAGVATEILKRKVAEGVFDGAPV